MRGDTEKWKKHLVMSLPYIIFGFFCMNLGEAWRLAEGTDLTEKTTSFFSGIAIAFASPLPGFYPEDLLTGLCAGTALRLAVFIRGRNRKKYMQGKEYGSARWGGPKDIAPFIDPVFRNNVILTKTERLMMSNRPKNPANARNKNVLIIGGSGSGKTRFWIKPSAPLRAA